VQLKVLENVLKKVVNLKKKHPIFQIQTAAPSTEISDGICS
jgi:hypothetical protein